MMLGQSRLWQWFPRQEQSLVEQLSRTAEALARDGVGALMVIEREDDLSHLCETGERIDAELSAALLRAIFTTRSPLHDGAVIVRKGRVTAAACQLPLRVRDAQAQDRAGYHLGMRHRAALSTSEETDAILVVVSEETGRISIAQRGSLEPVPQELLARRLAGVLSAQTAAVFRKAA
jgi:diadenylate cyclase